MSVDRLPVRRVAPSTRTVAGTTRMVLLALARPSTCSSTRPTAVRSIFFFVLLIIVRSQLLVSVQVLKPLFFSFYSSCNGV